MLPSYFSCKSLLRERCTQMMQPTMISAIGGKSIRPQFE